MLVQAIRTCIYIEIFGKKLNNYKKVAGTIVVFLSGVYISKKTSKVI